MKKILVCGLILSMLTSVGSVCFAGIGDSDIEEEIDDAWTFFYDIRHGREQKEENTKKPRKTKPEKRHTKSDIQQLRDRAIALLSGYYEENFGLVWYTCIEISEMTIENLNGDYTVLTLAGVSKQLPPIVSQALKEYLGLRAEFFPETMGAKRPLFTCTQLGYETEAMGGTSVHASNKRGRQQLDRTFYDVTEVRSTIVKLRDKASSFLYVYFQMKKISNVASTLSEMNLGDIVSLQQSLMVDGTRVKLSDAVWAVLWEYLDYRETYFPETMKYDLPLFIDCENPKKANHIRKDHIMHMINIYRKRNAKTMEIEEE